MTMTAAIDFLLVPFPWDHTDMTSALGGVDRYPKRNVTTVLIGCVNGTLTRIERIYKCEKFV